MFTLYKPNFDVGSSGVDGVLDKLFNGCGQIKNDLKNNKNTI
jgi:hypothetical protein